MFRSVALATSLVLAASAVSADVVIFENVRVFDGTSPSLSDPVSVLVRGNVIDTISPEPIAPQGDEPATRIDGTGNTLMPGSFTLIL